MKNFAVLVLLSLTFNLWTPFSSHTVSAHAVNSVNASAARSSASEAASFNVGHRIHSFAYALPDGTTKRLMLALWYPTLAQPQPYWYKRLYVPGKVALNSAIYHVEPGGLPLIVHSHGYAECGTASAYIHQYMASQGYLVVAPDHEDAYNCTIDGGKGTLKPWDISKPPFVNFPTRPTDIVAVLDEIARLNAESSSPFFRAINENAIGVSGHSLGAVTVGAISGGMAALSAGTTVQTDPRVRATLLLSLSELEPADFYSGIRVPVMHQFGEYDWMNALPAPDRTHAFDHSNSPKFLAFIRSIGHYGFTDRVCKAYLTVEGCQQYSPPARTILRYGTGFFDSYLNGVPPTQTVLTTREGALYSYDYRLQ